MLWVMTIHVLFEVVHIFCWWGLCRRNPETHHCNGYVCFCQWLMCMGQWHLMGMSPGQSRATTLHVLYSSVKIRHPKLKTQNCKHPIHTGILHTIAMYEKIWEYCDGNIAKTSSTFEYGKSDMWNQTDQQPMTKSCRSRPRTWETHGDMSQFLIILFILDAPMQAVRCNGIGENNVSICLGGHFVLLALCALHGSWEAYWCVFLFHTMNRRQETVVLEYHPTMTWDIKMCSRTMVPVIRWDEMSQVVTSESPFDWQISHLCRNGKFANSITLAYCDVEDVFLERVKDGKYLHKGYSPQRGWEALAGTFQFLWLYTIIHTCYTFILLLFIYFKSHKQGQIVWALIRALRSCTLRCAHSSGEAHWSQKWDDYWLLVTPPRWITIFPIFTCHKWWLYHGIPYFQTHPHGGPTGKTAWSSLCYGHGCSLRWMAQVQPSQRDHQGEKLREPGMSLPFHLSLGCFDDGYHWLPQIGYHGIPMDRSNFGAVWIILGYTFMGCTIDGCAMGLITRIGDDHNIVYNHTYIILYIQLYTHCCNIYIIIYIYIYILYNYIYTYIYIHTYIIYIYIHLYIYIYNIHI